MKPLKPPLSYDEQIERMRSEHKLLVEDESHAKEILRTVNYYRLSAYGIGLKQQNNPEWYNPGVSLNQLYRLYSFDSKFRNILIPAIEAIEIELRTKIAYHLAMTYGAEGYRLSDNFIEKYDRNGNNIHTSVIQKFDTEVIRQENLPCVIHHNTEYGGHFPIWVAIELFTFGMLSSLFSVLKPKDCRMIANEYNSDKYHLKSWILSLLEIRNLCAHYNRIYNMPLKQTPTLYKEYEQYQNNRLFAVLLVIKRMSCGKAYWKDFLVNLHQLIDKYPEADLIKLGFPENWENVLEK